MKKIFKKIYCGRVWKHFGKNYNKCITFEWRLRPLEILNYNLRIDGSDREYTFNFWCIWVFYISFKGIFKWFPKEYNSYAKQYLNTDTREIGISQYRDFIQFHIWTNERYTGRENKGFYYSLNIIQTIVGQRYYHTLEENDYVKYLKLEKNYKLEIHERCWHRKSQRWLFRFLNHKGKSWMISSELWSPNGKYRDDRPIWFVTNKNADIDTIMKKLKDYISKDRMGWIPEEYRKNEERKQKLNRIKNKL